MASKFALSAWDSNLDGTKWEPLCGDWQFRKRGELPNIKSLPKTLCFVYSAATTRLSKCCLSECDYASLCAGDGGNHRIRLWRSIPIDFRILVKVRDQSRLWCTIWKAKAERVCKFWADGKCVKGERCPYLHTWFRGDGFSFLTKLQGHKKGITGIALPDNSSYLYSAAKDGTVRVWDCNTGQCSKVINLGAEAGCLISKGVWVFCGASNLVKAWNTECNTKFTLAGPVGQVHAMEVENDMVFAGTEEGVIYVWKGKVCSDTKGNPFHPHQALSGHTGAVVSLRVGTWKYQTLLWFCGPYNKGEESGYFKVCYDS
ncbi:hypothetical protein ACLB2K_040693 [Fragaria x ananassa]